MRSYVLLFLVSLSVHAQPALDPVAEFNGIRTAPHLRDMLKKYQKHGPVPFELSSDKMFSEHMKGMTAYQFKEGSPRGGIILLFCSSADSIVTMAQYTIKPPQFERHGEAFWNDVSRMLGDATSESTLPMLGKRKMWERGSVTVQLILFDTAAKAVSLSYLWKR